MKRALDLFLKHRRRFAPLVLVLGVVGLLVQTSDYVPRDVTVRIPLGSAHASVAEAQVDYVRGDELAHSIRRVWPEGAPRALTHEVELMPGEYDVSVRLLDRDGGQRRMIGHLTAPADGVIRVALENQ
jgi:hypothetical protein